MKGALWKIVTYVKKGHRCIEFVFVLEYSRQAALIFRKTFTERREL